MSSGKQNRRSRGRVLTAAILSFLAVLAWGGAAWAAEYSVDVGIDTTAGRDAGTLECTFGKSCRAKLEPLKLSVSFDLSGRNRDRVTVSMDSDEAGCCYFESAASSIVIDLGNKLSPLPIFRGERARGAMFIQNERVGTLYFRFLRR